jgi:hypothetical protein
MKNATRSLALVILLSWLLSGTSSADVLLLSPGEQEWNIDRPGMNLRAAIPLSKADPDLCRNECTKEPGCSAWTYVHPGVLGPSAMCWLKSGVPAPVPSGNHVSGTYNKLSADLFVDRPGADITGIPLSSLPSPPVPSSDPCREACSSLPYCVAYTVAAPAVQGASAMCWLKWGVPAPVPNANTVSGAYTVLSTERDTNRPGMDYMSFDLPLAEPDLCRQACAKDGTWRLAVPLPAAPPIVAAAALAFAPPHCRAYTYVNPGVHGDSARCFLKSGVPAAVTPRQCCVSGIARDVSFAPGITACPYFFPRVATTPVYPQVLSSSEFFLKYVANLKALDPARKLFDIGPLYLPDDSTEAWRVRIEESVQPTLGSDEVLVVLDNQRGDGETKITAYDGAACSFGSSVTAAEGHTNQIIFNRASASTLVFRRDVCDLFACLGHGKT